MASIIVVDTQNDFISGSLAAFDGKNVARKIYDFLYSLEKNYKESILNLKSKPDVFYSLDWHDKTHESFKQNGGIWQTHCIAGSAGAALFEPFFSLDEYMPSFKNMFYKAKFNEQYSAFEAKNELNQSLKECVKGELIVVGFVLEYCVLNTALEFKKAGFNVSVISELCAITDKNSAKDSLKRLKDAGVRLL